MRHIDLFSGIGGFALAAREVWGEEYNNVCFCEINKPQVVKEIFMAIKTAEVLG
jgi:site-specific DNA-cytosine methylase